MKYKQHNKIIIIIISNGNRTEWSIGTLSNEDDDGSENVAKK